MSEDDFSKASPYFPGNLKEKFAIVDTEPAWTTTRCHRLLRPLSSKIALLRKMKTMGSKELCNPMPDTCLDRNKGLSSWGRPACSSQESTTSSSDCGWDNSSDWTTESRPRKRLRRTYSSKSSVQVTCPSMAKATQTCETSAQDILRVFNEKRFFRHTQLRDSFGGLALHGLSDDEPEKFPSAKTESVEWEVGCGQKTPLRGAFTKLARNLSPVNWRTLDGLHDGLLALLKATGGTSQGGQRSKTGVGYAANMTTMEHRSKSLFATCLRKIPACIIEEQQSTTAEDPENDVDVSTTIYNYLEQMNPTRTRGWKPLKDVLRAHGIALLASAIEESLVILPIARALVILCLEQGACNEAAVIVEAMIKKMKPLPKPESASSLLFSYQPSVTLQAMHTMLLITKCSTFEYAQLARLFEADLIPFEWICTPDMVDCWTRAIISTTQRRPDAAAASMLIRTVLAKSYTRTGVLHKVGLVHDLRTGSRLKRRNTHKRAHSTARGCLQDATDMDEGHGEEDNLTQGIANVIANLLTVLTAISLFEGSKTPVLTQIGVEAQRWSELRSCGLATTQPLVSTNPGRLALVLLASALPTPGIDNQYLESFTHQLDQSSQSLLVVAASFLCNVAECYGHVAAEDPFEVLQNLIRSLDYAFARQAQNGLHRAMFNTILIDAAFKLAEQSGQPKYLEGALALEQKLRGGKGEHAFRTPGKTPAHGRQHSRNGFRWEEGICEWVAQSPEVALKLLESRSHESLAANHRSENSSENSPCAKRSSSREVQNEADIRTDCMTANPCLPHSRMRRHGRGGPKEHVPLQGNPHDGLDKEISFEVAKTPCKRRCEAQKVHALPRFWKTGPVVLVQRVKLDVLSCTTGTAKVVCRVPGAGLTIESDSEDELSVL